jgi:hypothetical protein
MGITDTNGRYTLTLAEDKNYTIFASKNDIAYWDTTAIIAPTKDIQIVLEKDEVRVGENATVKVYDRNGNKLDAAVRVRDPKGETKQLVGSTFTTKEVGTYTITASKEGKGEASKELTVKPSLLNIQWETKGRNLQIKVSDKGKPLENISVTFTGLVNGTLLTKDDGKVKVPLKKSGNYTIEVNTANANPMYEPATQTREIHKDNRVWLLILLMLIAAALTAIALAAVHKKDMAWITAHKKDTTWQTSKKTTPSLSEKGLRGVR